MPSRSLHATPGRSRSGGRPSKATAVRHLETDALTLEALIGKIDVRTPALAGLVTDGNLQLLYGLPIEVEGNLRGALLLADPESRGSSTRHARALARRFSVALGSEQRRAALLKQAYYDGLTGLPNRQLFKDRLEREIAHAKRMHTQVALIYIDLDRFKNVNDSMGHSAGDALLLGVSQRLVSQLRESDTLARLGGDEFVVIAPAAEEQPAHVLAERLQAALGEPIVVQGATCFAQASIGLAVYPQDGADVEGLLRSADIAMYRSKAAGPSGIMYFEEAMNRDAQRRLLIEQRLRVALRAGGLRLEYQAKVNLNDGSLAGVEALARWNDSQLGVVSPVEFIAVAEECGLIDELGTWVLREACSMYQNLREQGIDLGQLSVNVSMRQLRDDRFVNEVRDALMRHAMSAESLEIEVTESTLAGNHGEVSGLLESLRRMGVRIAIDDFGTGYSSMSVLAELPTDALKIDRSFVMESASQAYFPLGGRSDHFHRARARQGHRRGRRRNDRPGPHLAPTRLRLRAGILLRKAGARRRSVRGDSARPGLAANRERLRRRPRATQRCGALTLVRLPISVASGRE